MRQKHPFFIIAILFIFLLSFSSCSSELRTENKETVPAEDEYTGKLTFDGRRYTYTGMPEDISADGDRLIIKKNGIYLVSGRLSEGRISVECVGSVALVFGGFEGSSSHGAVIERSDGGELQISALPDTVNILRTQAGASDKSGTLPAGCVLSSGRLVMGGIGRLTVSAPNSSGAVCSDLLITSGELSISCSDYGIWAKNSARVIGGTISFTSANIGIYSHKDTYNNGKIDILTPCRIRSLCRTSTFQTNGTLTVTATDIEEST